MAKSALKKKTTVDIAEYNNFIKDFKAKYQNYYDRMKDLVEKRIAGTVMKKDVWTDSSARDYAVWFNDQSKVSDGCDCLNVAIREMDKLFRATCYAPVNDIVKLVRMESVQDAGAKMIQEAYKREMRDLLARPKYRKQNFPKLRLKVNSGEKIAIDASKINTFVNNVEADVKYLIDKAEAIKKLVQAKLIKQETRCINIEGFTGKYLNSQINVIENSLKNFKTLSERQAESAIGNTSSLQQKVESKLESDTSGETSNDL